MGFRLGSFLGGMAEAAVEIEEGVRKRNQELIDTSLTLSAERTARSMEERKKQQEVYDVLAKQLKDFGLEDKKVNIVLSYGPEVASDFLKTAPIKAKREGMSVGDYVVLLESGEGNLPETSTRELIQFGSLPGMPTIEEPTRPELQKSPIFGRDYSSQYDATRDALFGGMGIEIPEQREGITVPEGGIRFMDLIGGEGGGDGLSLTRAGVFKSVGEYLAPLSDVDLEMREDGTFVFDNEKAGVLSAITNIQTRTVSVLNNLMADDPAGYAQNPELYYQKALNSVLQTLPEGDAALFPRLNPASPPPVPPPAVTTQTPQQAGNVRGQITAIDNDPNLTDAQRTAKKRAVIRSAGLADTPAEADQILASGNF